MTDYSLDDRFIENRAAWTDYWKTFTIERFGAVLAVIALVVAVAGYINQHGGLLNLTNIFGDFYANVSSELISIVITVLVVDRLNRAREKRDNEALQARLDEQELTRLKALLGSNENVVTKIAVAELSAKGWLEDGSLADTYLREANLTGAYLRGAWLQGSTLRFVNLEGANLMDANLEDTNLSYAQISGANLSFAQISNSILYAAIFENAELSSANLESTNLEGIHLKGANVRHANLSGANMVDSYLEGTNLMDSNLEGVDLMYANLEHTNMYGVRCNEKTILPDGTTWTSDVDWAVFGAVELNAKGWNAYRKEHGLDKKSE